MFLRRFFCQFIVPIKALTNKVTFIFGLLHTLKTNIPILMINAGFWGDYLYPI